MPAVTGFVPSAHGFHFANSWPHVAAFTVNVRGIDVPIGDASKGLCGGMVFAARDYFESHRPIPNVTATPSNGLLYEFIGQRLKDSFGLPLGPTKYLDYMAAPDGDKGIPVLSWFGWHRVRGIAWRTIHDELPRVLADIDANQLSCLGLVCTHSVDPRALGENHQVLAYRYARSGYDVRIWVYDPNRPGGDDVYLQFSTAQPNRATPLHFVNGSKDVRGFFRVTYASRKPPA